MSAKNVVLAQRNGNGVDVVLPRTSADLTGYENADAPGVETVAEALDDIYARSPGNIAALAGWTFWKRGRSSRTRILPPWRAAWPTGRPASPALCDGWRSWRPSPTPRPKASGLRKQNMRRNMQQGGVML